MSDLSHTPPEQSMLFLMAEVSRLMRRRLMHRADAVGLAPAQWRALAYLSHHEGVNQACLAEMLEVKPISLARTLDRLQEAGLVERRTDPKDRRVYRLYIREQATPIIERMREYSSGVRSEALKGIDTETRAIVLRCLQAMKANLSTCGSGAIGGADASEHKTDADGTQGD